LQGSQKQAGENERIELSLDHVTGLLGGHFLKVDSGDQLPRELLPVHVYARNNIFSPTTQEAFVSMSGTTPATDFQRLLTWNGERNFYDDVATFWLIASLKGAMEFEPVNFERWNQLTSQISEVGAQNDPVIWAQQWEEKPFDQLELSDLALIQDASLNPAVSGAADATDAGVDFERLPKFFINETEETTDETEEETDEN